VSTADQTTALRLLRFSSIMSTALAMTAAVAHLGVARQAAVRTAAVRAVASHALLELRPDRRAGGNRVGANDRRSGVVASSAGVDRIPGDRCCGGDVWPQHMARFGQSSIPSISKWSGVRWMRFQATGRRHATDGSTVTRCARPCWRERSPHWCGRLWVMRLTAAEIGMTCRGDSRREQ
jgi:hypothetical protein